MKIFKKIFDFILAALAVASLVLGVVVLMAGITILGVIAIASFASGNICYGILAILAIVGFILILKGMIENAW